MTRRFSRRRFCKTTAAVAAPLIISRTALADDTTPGANDQIGVAVIAPGRRGNQLLGIPKEGRFVAGADVNLPRAQSFAKRYSARAYQDYRKMLDEGSDIDACIIASPDHWHALHSIHACQAGKDVYVEKPMTLTIREGRVMVEIARKHKRIVQCGSQQRSMAANRFGCELVRNGRIGKILRVQAANYPSPWNYAMSAQPIPDGLDWDMWCGQVEPVPYNKDLYTPRAKPGWISFRRFSGGEVTGWGAHGIDQIQWALGMDESGPVEIWTEGPEFDPPTFTEPGSRGQGEGITKKPTVFMKYANGVILEWNGGPPGGGVFIGEKGRISIDRGRYSISDPALAADPIPEDGINLRRSTNHMQHWFDCMRSRELSITDVEIGHRSATVCHLANIARWTGRKLQWDPEKECFPGDEEANALVDRPRRKPYELPEV